MADPAQRVNYQVLKNKYGGWNYANFEAAIKKAQRPSELDELRIAAKYFLGPEDAMKADEANHQRLNELSDRLISFGDFMRAYKNAESGFMAMRDRCVKAGNNWVCASYMSQVEFFINSQAKDTSTGGRGPLNDMLGKVREGYETVKILEQKWKEYKEKGEKDKLPGFEEEEIKDIFKGFLAKEIGQDRFWASMDIRSEVEGKPIITPAKKKELIDLWAKHGIMLPAQKQITKPEVIMPKPPATPMEPVPLEEMRQVIKKEEDLEKRIEELRKKKELEKQREKERMEKEWQKLPKPEARPEKPAPSPPAQPAPPSPELDLMKDEIEKRIAEMMRRKRAGEGQAGEPAAKYITPKILDRKEIAHLSKDIEDNCVPLGYVNLYSLFPKSRFGTDTGILYDCRNVDSSKLKRDTIARGESDIIIATSSKPYRIKFYPDLKEIIIGELQAGEPAARYDAKKKDLNAPMTTLLQVTGTESRYSGSQYIKTPVIVSVEQDQYAKYLIYRRGAGKEASTSFHAKTFTNMYVLRYQGAFGYTVELGFTDEKNNAIKIMLDPAPGKIINGIVFENERKIAEFDVDEASFRKAEQFARENKVIKEMRGGYNSDNYKKSYAELHYIISTWDQGFDKLKELYAQIDDYTGLTNFDKETLKEQISRRMQDILSTVELMQDVDEVLSTSSCPRCGTHFTKKPGGSSCPKCGTFVPEKLSYEPEILPEKSYSYAELQFRIKICQDVETLKKVHAKIDTSDFTEFDKELLKEEIAQRMQAILEYEEAHKPGAGEKFAEGAAEYTSFMERTWDKEKRGKQKEILKLMYPDYDPKRHDSFVERYNKEVERKRVDRYMDARKIKEPGVLNINPKLLQRKEIAHLSKDIEDKCIPLGYINIYSLHPKSRFGTDTAILYDCRNTDSSKLKRDTIVKGENDIIIATSSKIYLKRFHPNLTKIMFSESMVGYDNLLREQKTLDIDFARKFEPDKKEHKTPLELAKEERLKQYPTEESFRTAKTKYADFLESDFHLKYHKDKAEQYKPGSIQYNKHMAVYKERLEEIANLRKEAAAGKTLLEMQLEDAERQNKEYEAEIEAHQKKLAALRGESYESLLVKAKSFNQIWGDASKPWKERYKGKDEVKDIILVLKEKNIDIIPILNEQLHELQNKNKIKESGNGYELSDEEYNRAKKLNFDELINLNICPECMHKMVNGKCLLHGTRDQILRHYSKYTIKETDDEIIQQIKNEQGNLKGLKCTTIKSFHKPGFTVVVMKPYQDGQGLGSMGSTSLYDINFKEEISAKRLEAKLKLLFESRSDVEGNTLYDKVGEVNTDYLVGDTYNIQDITGIKQAALSGKKTIWVNDKGREGLILASKYGKDWWEKATQCDIQRMAVYESSGKYSVAEKARNIQMQGYARRLEEKKKPDGYKDSLAMRLFGKKYSDLDSEKKKAIDDRLRKFYELTDELDRAGFLESDGAYFIKDSTSVGDPDTWVKSKGAAFLDDIHGAHRGQVDGTLRVYDAKTQHVIGYIDYSIFEAKIYINGIEVEHSRRRRGFATALVLKLKKLNPGIPVKWGMMTDEGCALKNAVDKESKDITPSGGVLGEKRAHYRSVEAFLRYHKTGYIDNEAYHYNTIESLSWLRPEEHKIVVKIISTGKGIIQLRKGNEKLRYVKVGEDGEICRDSKTDLALYLSDEEIVAKKLPKTDTTIVAFNDKNQAVAFAADEWGADGVWVVDEYQKHGIGTALLSELRKQFPPDRKIGQMTEAGQALASAYYRHQIEDELTKQRQIGAAKAIAATTGERMEGKIITLDDIANLSRDEKLKAAKILMGPPETKKEVIQPYKDVTFDDFKHIISRTTDIDDLAELDKHISESVATTPRERIELHNIIEQREREVGSCSGCKIAENVEVPSIIHDAQDMFRNVKDNCSEWDFGTFEVMIAGIQSEDDGENLLECIASSSKLTDVEKETLSKLIEKGQ